MHLFLANRSAFVSFPSGCVDLISRGVPAWGFFLHKPPYKWVKHQTVTGGPWVPTFHLPLTPGNSQREFYRQWNRTGKTASAEGMCFVCTELCYSKNLLSFLPLCSVLGDLHSQAPRFPPSPSSLTNSLCQALPQAAPCNYSPMPQTGEMGVRYTLCA